MTAQAEAFPRTEPETKLLDAAERLLVEVGYGAITTRNVAATAGVNHGLVHYYFGSMEELFVQVLERFTERLIERQRAMYAADEPFLKKWRRAMRYLEADFESGYQKVWLELQAMAWNRAELRDRVAHVNEEWRRVITRAFEDAAEAYGVDTRVFPIDAIVALVVTFNQGMILERHSGISGGHRSLLRMLDRIVKELDGGVKR
ncbi:MAG: TetR/AcrR family transcriptional regulator [Actinomycetota bacterium]